jgi:hypothetical protein
VFEKEKRRCGGPAPDGSSIYGGQITKIALKKQQFQNRKLRAIESPWEIHIGETNVHTHVWCGIWPNVLK